MAAYTTLTDSQLIDRLKDADASAFAEIYNRYAKSLTDFTASKLFSLEDAQDIIHDLFVRLWEEKKQLHISSNLQTYLFTICRRRIIDKIRRNVTREAYALMLQSPTGAYQTSVEQQLAAKELQQTIETSLKDLSPRVKEIYQLSRQENLSIPEIANKLGLSEQTVKNQLSAALAHLRKSVPVISASVLLLRWLS